MLEQVPDTGLFAAFVSIHTALDSEGIKRTLVGRHAADADDGLVPLHQVFHDGFWFGPDESRDVFFGRLQRRPVVPEDGQQRLFPVDERNVLLGEPSCDCRIEFWFSLDPLRVTE